MNYTQPIGTEEEQKEPILRIWRELKSEEHTSGVSEEQNTSDATHTVDQLPIH